VAGPEQSWQINYNKEAKRSEDTTHKGFLVSK